MIDNIEELYELILQDDEDGVFANSLVESPAIERDFVWLNKEVAFQSVSDEKQLVAGPILVPNKKILRIDGEGKRYSVFFTPETIEMVARKFMKNKYGDEVTLEHGNKTAGVYLTESWIVEQSAKDKSNVYGFTLPRGTWFGVYKVDDKNIWDKVKDGTFRGFSIEGLFEHKKSDVKLSLDKHIEELTDDEVEILLSQIKSLILEQKGIELESYNDYPESASNNAKRALEWADKNGWGDCGEATGKQRANSLAKRESISRDTIARMASFKRHQQHKDVPYSEGCGGLMWDSWGGTSGVEWAINKLKEIDLEAQPSIPNSTYAGEPAKKKKDDK
jgi:GTPase SAR1 family protein